MAKTNSTKYQILVLDDPKVRLANLQATGVDVSAPRTVQIIHMTKAIADSWLPHNARNRQVDDNTVKKYKRAMVKGNWNFEGYISFDSSGALSNGQHRLWAFSETGLECDVVVVYGMEINADTDTGKQRTAFENFCLMNKFQPELLNRKTVGVVRAMLRRRNKGHKGASNSEIEEAMKEWSSYLKDMAPLLHMKAGSTWFNVALMAAYMNGVDFHEIQSFKAAYVNMGSRGRVPNVELPIKALHDAICNLPGSGTDQNMNFILTATQNALYEYINKTGSNYCVSSKDAIWDYDCTFMNKACAPNHISTDMYY